MARSSGRVPRETWRGRQTLPAFLALFLALACSSGSVAGRGEAPPGAPDGSASAPARPPPLRPVKMSFATDSAISLPVWIAQDQGLWQKYGIDVSLTYLRGGATNTQALLSGSIDMSLSGAVAAITSNLAGADVRFFATTAVLANQAIVTQPSITNPQQLRGETIGLGVAGGSSTPQLAEALRRMGLSLSDVRLLDIPIQGDRLAALMNGSVVAIMVPQAVTEQAVREGYYVMMDLLHEEIPNQGQSMVALQSYIEQNPAIVKDVLRGFCEAIYVELTDRARAEESIARWAKVDDPRRMDSMYRASADLMQKKPYPSLAGIQSILDGLAEQTPAARTARPERFVNDALLRQLDDEGFIDALWQR